MHVRESRPFLGPFTLVHKWRRGCRIIELASLPSPSHCQGGRFHQMRLLASFCLFFSQFAYARKNMTGGFHQEHNLCTKSHHPKKSDKKFPCSVIPPIWHQKCSKVTLGRYLLEKMGGKPLKSPYRRREGQGPLLTDRAFRKYEEKGETVIFFLHSLTPFSHHFLCRNSFLFLPVAEGRQVMEWSQLLLLLSKERKVGPSLCWNHNMKCSFFWMGSGDHTLFWNQIVN